MTNPTNPLEGKQPLKISPTAAMQAQAKTREQGHDHALAHYFQSAAGQQALQNALQSFFMTPQGQNALRSAIPQPTQSVKPTVDPADYLRGQQGQTQIKNAVQDVMRAETHVTKRIIEQSVEAHLRNNLRGLVETLVRTIR